MLIARRKLLITSGLTVVSLGACTPQEKVFLVVLKVSPIGNYEVNGKQVTREALEATLGSLKPKEGIFGIHFQPDKAAPQESVQYAVTTAQKLGAKLGTVGNEQF